MTACAICGKESPRRTCGRTHENQLWRQENPEAYAAARNRYNQKRNERRKADKTYGREKSKQTRAARAPIRKARLNAAKPVSWDQRRHAILDKRDKLTHSYRA